MPPPTDRRTPRSPVRADPRAQDRTIRALMSVVDDLTVEREEEGLLRSTLSRSESQPSVAAMVRATTSRSGPAGGPALPRSSRRRTASARVTAISS
ncbi:MAG TPA: hypothetical protein VF964_07520, partial [Vicinamibacteria bacterium]